MFVAQTEFNSYCDLLLLSQVLRPTCDIGVDKRNVERGLRSVNCFYLPFINRQIKHTVKRVKKEEPKG